MAQIIFDENTLKKVKNKIGLYSKLEEPIIISTLKNEVTKLIERAFRQYCKAHKASIEIENKEWIRFNKYLQKNL